MKIKDTSWQIEHWRAPHVEGLELLSASNITHDYPRHIHEAYGIVMMERGQEISRTRAGTFTASSGELMLLNADEAHTSRSINAQYHMMSIPQTVFLRLASQATERSVDSFRFLEPVVRDRTLYRSLLNLHLALRESDSSLEQQSSFVSTITTLLAHCKPDLSRSVGREVRRIKVVRDYVREHYAENISLITLSSVADLTGFHLVRVFREHVGVPPHEYQTHIRVNKAKVLLRSGYSIADAALMVGFCDQSHLSRNFRRITGMTPGYYASYSIS